MADQAIKGFKINTILDRLAVDMLGLVESHLSAGHFDRDRYYLSILLTLSKKLYISQLLYRDFRAAGDQQWHRYQLSGDKVAKVHEQSIVYLHQVLMRRLRLARRLKHEPGNMHLLLAQLARFGTRRRRLEPRSNSAVTSRSKRMKGWMISRAGLRPNLRPSEQHSATISVTRPDGGAMNTDRSGSSEPPNVSRDAGGNVLVRRDRCRTFTACRQTSQEMSTRSDWSCRVLDSLNERYTLLRSCGLDPERWHERETPSIAKLRDLKRLRRQAEDYLRQSIEDEQVRSYRRAFDDLADDERSDRRFRKFR